MSGKEDPENERTPVKEGRPSWCEPGLVIPIMGSILLLVLGQITNTFVDIKYGLEDSSDFAIVTDPPGESVFLKEDYKTINVSVEDRHEFVCPYGHTVYLKTKSPDGLTADFADNNKKPPFNTRLTFRIDREKLSDKKEIKLEICGFGGDGKVRNATYVLNIYTEPPENIEKPTRFNATSAPVHRPFKK